MSQEGPHFEASHEEPEAAEPMLEDERVPGQLGEELGEAQREELRAVIRPIEAAREREHLQVLAEQLAKKQKKAA